MTKTTYAIIAVILLVLVAGLVWWGGMHKEQTPAPQQTVQPADTTGAIQKSLSDVNIGDVEANFKDVDQTIKSL